MKRIAIAAVIAVASLVGLAGNATAAGQICHDVTVNVNGESLLADAQCTPLP
jgi:hypothetical protein